MEIGFSWNENIALIVFVWANEIVILAQYVEILSRQI
jgi:hypothetical protein